MQTSAPPHIVDEIAKLCESKGVGPRQLARQASISVGSAQRILARAGVSTPIVEKAARSLGYQLTIRHTLTRL